MSQDPSLPDLEDEMSRRVKTTADEHGFDDTLDNLGEIAASVRDTVDPWLLARGYDAISDQVVKTGEDTAKRYAVSPGEVVEAAILRHLMEYGRGVLQEHEENLEG